MRVLHLGFEDPGMPGAGGGAVRTHEIDRRLAAKGFRMTVLTTRYPGWSERTQDGVHYVPIGIGRGGNRLTRLLGYVFLLPLEVHRRRAAADLVVEDFFAPFSSMAAPLWTTRPTVGLVQWLHAREKARQYGLPLHWVERWAVRRYRRMIAVSQGIADRLKAMNPDVHVDVIGNGVDPAAWKPEPKPGQDVLCIGRLEFGGKGLDLLLAAWEECAGRVDGQLLIAGSGPDEAKLHSVIEERGLSNRVRLLGWLSGEQKFQAMSEARLVVLPSRQETFGLVAIEALAVGTPVIAFDIPCLREIVPDSAGWLVPPFDVDAFAAEIARRYPEAGLMEMGSQGRAFASGFNWDRLAEMQAESFRDAVAEAAPSGPHPPGRSPHGN
ncbi:glycosyltransferase family 4 protein [Arthrobacter sp. StoSoilB5]|uniref:glycosyltransferase family 4 protein n=1 Tax=Arthrobacter sp. StoSoilB5 TaxID=2830992 RepID=UPI001CC4813B|nr:glycosyltransferase family 4 protein [Arthrobacter sp. StoSoilB5]BCW44170.1 glycogen synthase [Arthrobacter sp. StoSoilB5]